MTEQEKRDALFNLAGALGIAAEALSIAGAQTRALAEARGEDARTAAARVQETLARWEAKSRSARTANHDSDAASAP